MQKGLPVPDQLQPEVWQQWSNWFGSNIGAGDVTEAASPILETHCRVSPGRTNFPTCMAELNSFDFTTNSQPGNAYREPPSSSCFSPETMVVMADGTRKPIETVQAGDKVRMTKGERAVALVATPRRQGRTLYAFDGYGFAFTSTHPFVSYSGGAAGTPTYAAKSPQTLAETVPTLAQFGIASLTGDGAVDIAQYKNGSTRPYKVGKVEPAPGQKPDVLYDLILEMGEDGISQYLVGDNDAQFLVSSEIPRYMDAPETAHSVLVAIQGSVETILATMAEVPEDQFSDILYVVFCAISRTLMVEVGPKLRENLAGASEESQLTLQALNDRVGEFIVAFRITPDENGSLQENGSVYNQHLDAIFQIFTQIFAPQFQATLALDWRTFDLTDTSGTTILAVTLYALELFGSDPGVPVDRAVLQIDLSKGRGQYRRYLPVQPSQSRNHTYFASNGVAYFSEWHPILTVDAASEPGVLWQASVALVDLDTGKAAPFYCTFPIPAEVQPGYQMLQELLRDANGAPCGLVQLDIRTLNASGLQKELDQKSKVQDHELKWATADRLGHLSATYVRDTFPVAFELLKDHSAVAPHATP